jgi:hypothetical protein
MLPAWCWVNVLLLSDGQPSYRCRFSAEIELKRKKCQNCLEKWKRISLRSRVHASLVVSRSASCCRSSETEQVMVTVALRICFLLAPGSYVGRVSNYADWGFSYFFSPCRRKPEQYIEIGHGPSFVTSLLKFISLSTSKVLTTAVQAVSKKNT